MHAAEESTHARDTTLSTCSSKPDHTQTIPTQIAQKKKKKKCYTVLTQLRCKQTAGTKGGSRNDKGRSTIPTSKGSKHTLSVPSGVVIGVAMGGSCLEHWVERDD
jgi:hypothetical protein